MQFDGIRDFTAWLYLSLRLLLEGDGHGFVDLAISLVEGFSLPLDLAAVGSIKRQVGDLRHWKHKKSHFRLGNVSSLLSETCSSTRGAGGSLGNGNLFYHDVNSLLINCRQYSFVIGLTIATMPPTSTLHTNISLLLVAVGMSYRRSFWWRLCQRRITTFLVLWLGYLWRWSGGTSTAICSRGLYLLLLRVHRPSRMKELDGPQAITDNGRRRGRVVEV